MPTYDYECDACGHTFELFSVDQRPGKEKVPEMRQTETSAAVWHRRCDRLQRVGILSNGLPLGVLQKGCRSRQEIAIGKQEVRQVIGKQWIEDRVDVKTQKKVQAPRFVDHSACLPDVHIAMM